MTRYQSLRRLRILTPTLLLCSVAGVPSLAAAEETLRLETSLGGYSMKTSASPLAVLVDDPTIPFPRDPGDPLVNVSQAYTQARLSTGADGSALASTAWPGAVAANLLPLVVPGAPDYPIKAEARYPAGPQAAERGAAPGAMMRAEAKGLDVVARASAAEAADPATASFEEIRSVSTAQVDTADLALSRAVATAKDVSLLGGLIKIGEVRTTLEATSDGRRASTRAETTVSRLTVLGNGYSVDDKGAHAVQGDKPTAGAPRPGNPLQAPLSQLGISISPLVYDNRSEGSSARMTAGGLQIAVNTKLLFGILAGLPYETVIPLLDPLPPAVRDPLLAQIYGASGRDPQVTFILGRGVAQAAANLPIRFALPNLPPLSGGPLETAPLATAVLAPSAPGLTASPGLAAPPGAAGPAAVAVGSTSPADAVGIGFGVVLLGLLAAGGGGRGLVWAQAAGFGAARRGCELGAPEGVANLKDS